MRFNPFFIALACLLSISAHATQFLATNAYTVVEDQRISNEVWVVADTVQADGLFGNDLFAASGTDLSLKGTYEGNLWGAAGTTASLTGDCRRNARLAGQTLRIDGKIDGNLMAMGNTVIIGTDASIGGNARLIGSSVVLEGTIIGNVSINSARTVTLGGRIEGDVKVVSAEIILSPSARIEGTLGYTLSLIHI